jgi:hypothetical protein
VLKDSLYPLRSSIKRKEAPLSTEACTAVTSAKKKPQHEEGVQSASSGNVSTTQNASSNWCLQGTQVLRCIVSRVGQAIWKHLFRRASTVPAFR